MNFDYDQWQGDLSKLIAVALAEFRRQADDEMEIFALDCHPWNGLINLAFLTRSESKEDPLLFDIGEIAVWKYFDFSAELSSWQPALGVASRMRPVYELADEDNRREVVAKFLRSCAEAVASKLVQDMLARFHLAKGFRITVQHPDTGEEFYPPK
jgi:hypothetical protein